MELFFRAIPWMLLMFTSTIAEEFIVYDFDLDSKQPSENSTNGKTNVTSVNCFREHLYDHLDIREVTGKWKVRVVYMHLSNEGVNTFDSCPDVKIWVEDRFPTTTFGPSTENQLFHVQHINAKFRQEYRHLRLLWDEAGSTIEYSLYFRNDSAGYWQVFDGQNVTLKTQTPRKYQQFSGTIQVLKAVNDHLLLNFCQDQVNGKPAQLYSVLFTREPGYMERWELDSVHALLQNKKLSVASRRMVCGNSAERPLFSISSSIIFLILAYVFGSY